MTNPPGKKRNNGRFFRNQTLLYSSLITIVTISYAIMVVGFTILFQQITGIPNPIAIGVAVFIIAAIIYPIHNALEKSIARAFSRSKSDYQQQIQEFAVEVSGGLPPIEIAVKLSNSVHSVLRPLSLHVFLFDEENGSYRGIFSIPADKATEITFPPSSPLAEALTEQNSLVIDLQDLHESLQSEQPRLLLLNCNIFISLPKSETSAPNG